MSLRIFFVSVETFLIPVFRSKREHLINEIRSQASKIKELMDELEIAKKLQKDKF